FSRGTGKNRGCGNVRYPTTQTFCPLALSARRRKVTVQVSKAPDRRVARTQKLLRDALHSLIRERDYDSIAVKEILDRANVGRSTFYMHFRDKDDLLASSICDLLGTIPSSHPKSGDG